MSSSPAWASALLEQQRALIDQINTITCRLRQDLAQPPPEPDIPAPLLPPPPPPPVSSFSASSALSDFLGNASSAASSPPTLNWRREPNASAHVANAHRERDLFRLLGLGRGHDGGDVFFDDALHDLGQPLVHVRDDFASALSFDTGGSGGGGGGGGEEGKTTSGGSGVGMSMASRLAADRLRGNQTRDGGGGGAGGGSALPAHMFRSRLQRLACVGEGQDVVALAVDGVDGVVAACADGVVRVYDHAEEVSGVQVREHLDEVLEERMGNPMVPRVEMEVGQEGKLTCVDVSPTVRMQDGERLSKLVLVCTSSTVVVFDVGTQERVAELQNRDLMGSSQPRSAKFMVDMRDCDDVYDRLARPFDLDDVFVFAHGVVWHVASGLRSQVHEWVLGQGPCLARSSDWAYLLFGSTPFLVDTQRCIHRARDALGESAVSKESLGMASLALDALARSGEDEVSAAQWSAAHPSAASEFHVENYAFSTEMGARQFARMGRGARASVLHFNAGSMYPSTMETALARMPGTRDVVAVSLSYTDAMLNVTSEVACAAFAGRDSRASRQVQVAAIAGSDIHVLHFQNLQALRLQGHTRTVMDMCFSPNRTFLVSTSYDGTVRVWDTVHATCVAVHPLYPTEFLASAPRSLTWERKVGLITHHWNRHVCTWEVPLVMSFGLAASYIFTLLLGRLASREAPIRRSFLDYSSFEKFLLPEIVSMLL